MAHLKNDWAQKNRNTQLKIKHCTISAKIEVLETIMLKI
jgi:hypothetical protein